VQEERIETTETAVADADRRLVERVRGGDLRAFEALVRRYERFVFTLALRMLGDRDEADDVAQEIFLKAYTGLPSFRGASRFSTWLYAIASHHCLDSRASRTRRPVSFSSLQASGHASDDPPDPASRLADPAPRADELLERKEAALQVQAALAGLTDDHRLILILREIQGLSYDEIAESIGEELGTVRSRLHRARAAFRLRVQSAAADGREA